MIYRDIAIYDISLAIDISTSIYRNIAIYDISLDRDIARLRFEKNSEIELVSTERKLSNPKAEDQMYPRAEDTIAV